ncbi:MAG: hypothetical protein K0U52_01140 [Gammaproteobacteria bacterium]|nr:hypothetical protein [Gammaproteobacteria bacterium]
MKLIEVKLEKDKFVETGTCVDLSLETRMLLFGSNDGLWCDDLLFGHVGKDQKHFRISFSDEDHSKLDDFWSKESLSNDKFRFVPFDENKDTSISMVSKKTDLEKIYASLGLETMVNDSLIDDRLSFIDTSTKNCWEKKPTPIVPNYFAERFTKRGSKQKDVWNRSRKNFTSWTSVRQQKERVDVTFESNNKTWSNSITTIETRTVSVHEFSESDGRHIQQKQEINQLPERKENRETCQNQQRKEKEIETTPSNETELVPLDFTDVFAIQLMFEEKYNRGSKDVNVKNELTRKFTMWTSARKENKRGDMKFEDFEEKFWYNFKTWYYSIATLENRITSVEEFLKFDGLGPYEKHFEKMDMMDDDERNKKKETNERKTEMEPNVDMKTSSKKTETNIDKKIDTIVTRNQSRPEENAVKKTSSIKKTEIRKLWEDSRSNKTLETFERNVRHLWKNSNFKTMQFNTFTFVINQHYNGQIVKLTRKQFARTSHTIFLLCIRFKHICRQVVANFILTHERT